MKYLLVILLLTMSAFAEIESESRRKNDVKVRRDSAVALENAPFEIPTVPTDKEKPNDPSDRSGDKDGGGTTSCSFIDENNTLVVCESSTHNLNTTAPTHNLAENNSAIEDILQEMATPNFRDALYFDSPILYCGNSCNKKSFQKESNKAPEKFKQELATQARKYQIQTQLYKMTAFHEKLLSVKHQAFLSCMAQMKDIWKHETKANCEAQYRNPKTCIENGLMDEVSKTPGCEGKSADVYEVLNDWILDGKSERSPKAIDDLFSKTRKLETGLCTGDKKMDEWLVTAGSLKQFEKNPEAKLFQNLLNASLPLDESRDFLRAIKSTGRAGDNVYAAVTMNLISKPEQLKEIIANYVVERIDSEELKGNKEAQRAFFNGLGFPENFEYTAGQPLAVSDTNLSMILKVITTDVWPDVALLNPIYAAMEDNTDLLLGMSDALKNGSFNDLESYMLSLKPESIIDSFETECNEVKKDLAVVVCKDSDPSELNHYSVGALSDLFNKERGEGRFLDITETQFLSLYCESNSQADDKYTVTGLVFEDGNSDYTPMSSLTSPYKVTLSDLDSTEIPNILAKLSFDYDIDLMEGKLGNISKYSKKLREICSSEESIKKYMKIATEYEIERVNRTGNNGSQIVNDIMQDHDIPSEYFPSSYNSSATTAAYETGYNNPNAGNDFVQYVKEHKEDANGITNVKATDRFGTEMSQDAARFQKDYAEMKQNENQSVSVNRTVASSASSESEVIDEESESITESEDIVNEYKSINKSKNVNSNGFTPEQMKFFENLYNKKGNSDDAKLLAENEELKSQLEYLQKIKELENQIEKADQNLTQKAKSSGAQETASGDLTFTGSNESSAGDNSSAGASFSGASTAGGGVSYSAANSAGGADGTKSSGSDTNVTVYPKDSSKGGLYLKGMSISDINFEDAAVLGEIKTIIGKIYNEQIDTLIDNFDGDKLVLTLDDGTVLNIEASKVLSPDQVSSLMEKKKSKEELTKMSQDLKQKKSEMYNELLGLSLVLQQSGQY